MKYIPIIISVLIFLYLLWIVLNSWLEVKATPREEMFMCDKHGPLRKSETINFLDNDWCPLCFDEKMKKAEGQFGGFK